MKENIITIVFSILVIWGFSHNTMIGVKAPNGDSTEEKLFREALSKGRGYRSYYELVNETKKVVKAEDLINYCKSHGYLWEKDYKTKEISKFGDFSTSVYLFYFLPKNEFVNYVFDWTDRTNSNAGQLKSKGSVYFYNASTNTFDLLNNTALWTGSVVDGFVDGKGAGIWIKDGTHYYYFSGTFKRGFPLGNAKYRIVDTNVGSWGYSPREKLPSGKYGTGGPFREVEVGEMNDGRAVFRYLDSGDASNKGSNLYGFVDQNGAVVIKPAYKTAGPFSNGRAAVSNDKEEFYIDKNGNFVDHTPRQKKIYADAKAKEDSIKAEREREQLLAEQKAAEERRIAEEKEAALKKRIEANKNTKLWSRGCRLAYRYANGYEYVIATLEEWNENRTKVKVKIVASPSATRTLNGDLLEKNNTMWVSAHNEGWHLALDEEISAALNNDNSVRRIQAPSSSSSSSSSSNFCSKCGGRGVIQCWSCNGTGSHSRGGGWDEDATYETCSTCRGKGSYTCSQCNGTGRR